MDDVGASRIPVEAPEEGAPRRRGKRAWLVAVVAFFAGLLFGASVGGDGRRRGSGDADVEPEITRLSRSIEALAEATRRLAEAQSRSPVAARPSAAPSAAPAAAPPPAPAAPPAAAPERGEAPQIAPGVKFRCTFETGTDGWFVARFVPEIIGEVKRVVNEKEGDDNAREGKGALALTYDLKPGTVPLMVRMARGVNRLSLWMKTTKRPAEVMVGAQERDDSDYQTMFRLEPADGWKRFEFDFKTFTLSDDSADENRRLDFDQVSSVTVADASGFLGGQGENAIVIDEVVGAFQPDAGADKPPKPDEEEQF